MKNLLRLLLLALLPIGLSAQNTYNMGPIAYNPDPFGGGTNLNIYADDIFSSVQPLPFSFCFLDSSYSQIVVGSNGVITFDVSYANSYCPWPANVPAPDPSYPNLSIFCPYQDLDPSLGGTIRMDVRGVAPYRRVIISYDSIRMFSCTNLVFSQQVILYETTNIIECHILNKPLCATWNGGAAIHGLQLSGSTGHIVASRNFPIQWTASLDGYRFEPQGACAGAAAPSISGSVHYDLNGNCSLESTDPAVPNRSILANGGQYYAWTDASGNYEMQVAPGAYAVTEFVNMPYLQSSCLPGAAYNVNVSSPVMNIDFLDSAVSPCSDLAVNVSSAGLRRCATNQITLQYANLGPMPDSNATINLVLNDSMQIVNSSYPYTGIGANVYQFYLGLVPANTTGWIFLTVDVGCDTAGTVYCTFSQIVGANASECSFWNNNDSICQPLIAPLDPNSKYVAVPTFANNAWVQYAEADSSMELTYIIHFQNLGTSYAQDVEIRDTLDAGLIPTSLVPIGGSAPYQYTISGNAVLFRFENIMLPDSASDEPGSHGFITYRIAQRPGNTRGTVISNHASIYFDSEAPVVTNEAIVELPELVTAISELEPFGIKIYPNPANDRLQVAIQSGNAECLNLTIMDAIGRVVWTSKANCNPSAPINLDVQGFRSGMYFLRVDDGIANEVKRFEIMR